MVASRVPQVVSIADSDGVLVQPGEHNVSDDVSRLFCFTPVVAFVATGRSIEWGWDIGVQIQARGVFGENAAAYQMGLSVNGQYRLEDPVCVVDTTEIERLKKAMRFQSDDHTLSATISLGAEAGRVLVEPGKRVILTLGSRTMHGFQLPDCRWSAEELKEKVLRLIRAEGLNIEVVGPHPDGNIDLQPIVDGKVVDKSNIPDILHTLYPSAMIIALVDGINDKSLARHPLVYPITFANGCKEVKEAVCERGGLIIPKVGHEGGCLEALYYIRREFLGMTDSSKWNQEQGWVVEEDPKRV